MKLNLDQERGRGTRKEWICGDADPLSIFIPEVICISHLQCFNLLLLVFLIQMHNMTPSFKWLVDRASELVCMIPDK